MHQIRISIMNERDILTELKQAKVKFWIIIVDN